MCNILYGYQGYIGRRKPLLPKTLDVRERRCNARQGWDNLYFYLFLFSLLLNTCPCKYVKDFKINRMCDLFPLLLFRFCMLTYYSHFKEEVSQAMLKLYPYQTSSQFTTLDKLIFYELCLIHSVLADRHWLLCFTPFFILSFIIIIIFILLVRKC